MSRLLGYTTEQLWAKYQDIRVGSIGSFRRFTDPKRLQVQPETLAITKQVDANASFKASDGVKMVTGEKFGAE